MIKELFKALKILKFDFDKNYFNSIYQSHPEYPALLAVTDALTAVGVSHTVIKKKVDQISGFERKKNILAFIPIKGGKFDYIDSLLKDQELLNEWEGVAIVFNEDESINYKDSVHDDFKYKSFFQKISSFVLLLLFSLIFIYALINLEFFYEKLYFISSLLGVLISIAILYKEIGFKNDTLDSFCTRGDSSDCEDVLKSDYSYAVKKIKWSDLIFSYFSTQIIWIMYSQTYTPSITNEIGLFSMLSTISLVVVILSLYVQKVLLSTWCRLCLLISATVVMQSVIYFYLHISDRLQIYFTFSNIILLLIIFVVIFLSEITIKNLLKEKVTDKLSLNNLKQVIFRYDVFDAVLVRQEFNEESLNDTGFLLGNINAPIKLTIANNLYCNHCQTHFWLLLNLLEKYGDKFCVEFRFLLNSIDLYAEPNTNEYVYQYLLENANESNKQEILLKTLSYWYSKMDLKSFKKSCKVKNISCTDSKELVKSQLDWFNTFQISRTPTTFLNGYMLPAVFDFLALQIILPDLHQFYQKAQESSKLNTGNVAIPKFSN